MCKESLEVFDEVGQPCGTRGCGGAKMTRAKI